MKITHLVVAAYTDLVKFSNGLLEESKIGEISDTIHRYAMFSAVASSFMLMPGFGSLAAALAQTGLVWGTYVAINKVIGINLSQNVMKFVGSAMLTNLATNASSYVLAYVGAIVLTIIPGANLLAIPLLGAMGYILIYASAIIYLKLLTKVFRTTGGFNLDDSDKTRDMIDETVKGSDIEEIIKEGRDNFNAAKNSGEFKEARKNPRCPSCGYAVKKDQRYCSNCGCHLSK